MSHGWYTVSVPRTSGDDLAAYVLSRANNPATWSFESLGALVFRETREDEDSFFFCPKAAVVFEPFISTNNGKPCNSPLERTLLRANSARLVLGFKTHWEPVTRRKRASPRWESR
jgi:hypothetical protein